MSGRARDSIDTSAVDGVVGYRLRRAQLAVFARFLKHFEAAAVTPAEYSVLVLVADNPGLRPSQIAAALGIQRANFVALAAGLEARALLARRQAPGDRRSQALDLTAQGTAMVATLRTLQRRFEAELVAELGGTAERDRLLALLERLG